MENDAATLYCPNEACQAPNPISHNFCQRCSTPLPKRYLWAVADGLSLGTPGEILADRYLVIGKSVVLDIKPGLIAQTPELENLQSIRAYLRLVPYRLNIPEVYGVLPLIEREILLLEKPPLQVDSTTNELQMCPHLTAAWADATSMRQLNWLWQIAHLWQPMASEGVAGSLLVPELLRVEGSLIRLLELRADKNQTAPGLPELAEFWRQLLPEAKPAITDFLGKICDGLSKENIRSTEQLIQLLDRGLAELGRVSQTISIKITTKTDTGPSRQRNEDACYPPSGTIVTKPPQPTALAIVCDGIGGHAGGNVASNLAIETIQQQVQQLTKVPYDHIDPGILLADLEGAAAVANDKISQRNDSENRQGRQRMGTTLVMALSVAHEMYITHVGDSRAYWINHAGCYQVTLDDDVASREVRLGYAVYRDAIQQPASGSLVQALGMNPSSALHPTAQRFILDEDGVFLLCSDGLSDFDRVEQYWETEVLPILSEKTDVLNATDRLVEIASQQNGHDNITIALIHYQVKYSEPESPLSFSASDLDAIWTNDLPRMGTATTIQPATTQKTQVIPPDTQPSPVIKRSQLPLQLAIISVLVVAGGLLGYGIMQLQSPSGIVGFGTPSINPTDSPTASAPPSAAGIGVGWQLTNTKEIVLSKSKLPPNSASRPTVSNANALAGTVLQVIKSPVTQNSSAEDGLHLQVCSTPPNPGTTTPASQKTSNTTKPLLKAGDQVWIPAAKLDLLSNFSISKPGEGSQCVLPGDASVEQFEPATKQ
ncbi:MAG: protein phosphatase 2C domain-containing protein [Cyanomargarita calcarea GSE-NOS-MK-12-04C]|jgi:protein phosphatase|uniref:Protein phosphatase 2C domain-containing protein n=1 Tax=Cyanomargarita calcarea GSE-NOS-MK-12-04C TaxID=2839659 RepID=A0A951UST5_9CYAN|nr:protein phosphatase 2C domain-containing protein [Cyanomargarita calcarea GSE-NOS-MK-12-04C]